MEWKIKNDTPLPINSNNTQVQIVSVDIEHQKLIADNSTFEHVPTHLNVAYRIVFNQAYEATGAMLIYEGDQDTPDTLDEMPLWKIAYIVHTRLGIPFEIAPRHTPTNKEY